jgi:hypothetical protein
MQKLELKNVKFSEWNSEETNNFQAVVYLDGIKSGIAYNHGHGGPTDVDPIDSNFEQWRKLRDHCQSISDANKEEYYETFTVIDLLFEAWLENKDKARLQKEFNKGLCYTKNEAQGYRIMSFKRGGKTVLLNDMLEDIVGRTHLRKSLRDLENLGYKILNTNLNKLA